MNLQFFLMHNETPKSINHGGAGSRQHWAKAHREKMLWEGVFAYLLIGARVPKGMTRVAVQPTIRWKHKLRRDPENYRPSIAKPLADCLVKGGWLKDDTAEYFSMGALLFEYPQWGHADPRVKGVLVLTLDAEYE